VERQGSSLAISLEDRNGDAGGSIKLFFDSGSELELTEWLITDAQGLTTQVTVSNLVQGRKVAADTFQTKDFSGSPFRR